MWTWKTEEAVEWSMMTGITSGWIPTPIDAKPHGWVHLIWYLRELTNRQPCQNRSSAIAAESGSEQYRVKVPLALLLTSAVLATAV
jgi:hypothetical protein